MKPNGSTGTRNVARTPRNPKLPRVPGAPDIEHARSDAALRIAKFGQESKLFFAHFEHRVRLSLPQSWVKEEDPPGQWMAGVLGEPKYQAFRHDLLIASFHPGHRAKWTAHELCHALVGFAYRPGASTLFHALGAWLAELMPVALWYFFDEVGLRRCEQHAGQGAFQTHCEACEEAALEGPRTPDRSDARLQREGLSFIERELRAIRRSARMGLPQGTRYGTVDLASDGLTYARAHGPRLQAPEMERYVAQFFARDQGHHASLESLEARVVEMRDALTQDKKLRPWRATRWDYVAQDIGYRFLTLRAERTGELARSLDKLIDDLAGQRTEAGVARAMATYRGLAQAQRRGKERLPTPEDMFAVGYPLLEEASGSSLSQLEAGVLSACPGAHQALGRSAKATVAAFARSDAPERSPIGRRFAKFLQREKPGAIADLARVEAAVTHVLPRDPVAYALPSEEGLCERVRRARGAEVVRIDYDVLSHSGSEVKHAEHFETPRYLGVVRTGAEEVDLLELPEALGEKLLEVGTKLTRRTELPVEDAAIDELVAAGFLLPERYRL